MTVYVDCKWYTVSVESQGSSGKRKPHIEFEKDQSVELSVDKIDPKSVLPFICCFRLSS